LCAVVAALRGGCVRWCGHCGWCAVFVGRGLSGSALGICCWRRVGWRGVRCRIGFVSRRCIPRGGRARLVRGRRGTLCRCRPGGGCRCRRVRWPLFLLFSVSFVLWRCCIGVVVSALSCPFRSARRRLRSCSSPRRPRSSVRGHGVVSRVSLNGVAHFELRCPLRVLGRRVGCRGWRPGFRCCPAVLVLVAVLIEIFVWVLVVLSLVPGPRCASSWCLQAWIGCVSLSIGRR